MLRSQLGLELPGTLVFDYPTPAAIAALASHLLGEVRRQGASAEAPALAMHGSLDAAAKRSQDGAAIVLRATAVRSAGTVSLDAGGQPAVELSDAVGWVPCERWDADAQQSQVCASPEMKVSGMCVAMLPQ